MSTVETLEILKALSSVGIEAYRASDSHELRLAHIENRAEEIRKLREDRDHELQKKFFGSSDYPK